MTVLSSQNAAAFTRRAFLGGGAGLAAVTALTACGGSAGGAGGKAKPIRWGIYGNAEKLKKRGAAIAEWNRLHPDIPVNYEGVPSDSWPDKIATMISSGNAPDAICLGTSDMVQYATKSALEPLDSYGPKTLETGKFAKEVLDLGRVKGKLYGVPIAVSIQGIGYNHTILQNLGLGDPPDGWTYDQYASFAAQVHQKSSGKIYGSHDGSGQLGWLQIFLVAQGKQIFSPDGTKFAMTPDDLTHWFTYWADMRKSGGAVPPNLQAKFTGTEWPDSPLVKGSAVLAQMASQDLSGGYQALTKDSLAMTRPPSVAPGGSQGLFPQPTSSMCLNARSTQKENTVKVINWFCCAPASAKKLGPISGPPAAKPALAAVLALPNLQPVDKLVLKYSQAALAAAGPAPATSTGADAIADLFLLTSQNIAFGKKPLAAAVDDFFSQGTSALGRA